MNVEHGQVLVQVAPYLLQLLKYGVVLLGLPLLRGEKEGPRKMPERSTIRCWREEEEEEGSGLYYGSGAAGKSQ